jgi:hypothetical protein
MSSVDDILSGLDFDNTDGSARLPFLEPGKYVLAVKKVFIGTGFKGGKFTVEFEVIESEKTVADDIPCSVGSRASWIQKLGGPSRAALVGPNNVVGFLSAATGFAGTAFKATKEDPNSGKKRIKMLVGDEDGSMPEGPLVQAGVRVNALCYRTSSGSGTQITPVTFSISPGWTFKERIKAATMATQAPASA